VTDEEQQQLLRLRRRLIRLRWKAYDAQAPYHGDPNTFAALVEREANEMLDELNEVLGENENGSETGA